jgi:hypothetical protein
MKAREHCGFILGFLLVKDARMARARRCQAVEQSAQLPYRPPPPVIVQRQWLTAKVSSRRKLPALPKPKHERRPVSLPLDQQSARGRRRVRRVPNPRTGEAKITLPAVSSSSTALMPWSANRKH